MILRVFVLFALKISTVKLTLFKFNVPDVNVNVLPLPAVLIVNASPKVVVPV